MNRSRLEGLPDEGAYVIKYDDAGQPDELFADCGAKEAALRRYEQISDNWNAHLFVKIDSNSRNCTTPNAILAEADGEQEPIGVLRVRTNGNVTVQEFYAEACLGDGEGATRDKADAIAAKAGGGNDPYLYALC